MARDHCMNTIMTESKFFQYVFLFVRYLVHVYKGCSEITETFTLTY